MKMLPITVESCEHCPYTKEVNVITKEIPYPHTETWCRFTNKSLRVLSRIPESCPLEKRSSEISSKSLYNKQKELSNRIDEIENTLNSFIGKSDYEYTTKKLGITLDDLLSRIKLLESRLQSIEDGKPVDYKELFRQYDSYKVDKNEKRRK